MIILITEKFHDHPPQDYYVLSEDLDVKNPIDQKLKAVCLNHNGYSHKILVEVANEKKFFGADQLFWSDPYPSRKTYKNTKQVGFKPDKHIHLTICFNGC